MLDNTGKSLSDRLLSSFPLSLPTGLAFESVFSPRIGRYDDKREIPNKVQISQYSEIWINLWTLFRNLVSSVDNSVFLSSNHKELADILKFEIDLIDDLFRNEGQSHCRPIFYIPNYRQLRLQAKVKLREARTDAQKFYESQLNRTMEVLSKDKELSIMDKIQPHKRVKALILTHIPFDLLSYTHFDRLDLLESNTGKLKSRFEWNTKYYPVGENDLSHLPFNYKLLYIFGDRVLIHPSDFKLRKLILDISKRRDWVVTTTLDKILMDCELDIREPYVLEYVKKL